MPITVKVTPQLDAFDPYAPFNTPYGAELLELFKKGATLCVWRCTTPWNDYLETKRGDQYAISGKDEGEPGQGRAQLRGLRNLAKHGGRSAQVIQYSLSRWERGLPEKEWWHFDKDKARAAEVRWAQTQKRFKERTATQKPFAPDTKVLSDMALALVRTLRDGRVRNLQRFPELEDAFSELDTQGIIEMRRDGRFSLVPAAMTLRLPRGKRLEFTHD